MKINSISPEDEFNSIIDNIEFRAMASDGPVTPTLQAASEEELSRLWELVNEISPKRKALGRKILKGNCSDEEVNQYLTDQGLDPEQVGREGSVFVKTAMDKIRLEKLVESYKKYVDLLNEEINSLIGVASVHGWRSRNVEAGQNCRAEIESLSSPNQRH